MIVHFIGAGPGDPELMTIKGRRLLEEADLVVYADSLIHPGILRYAREDARLVGSSSLKLEEIVNVMADAARSGMKVVRLVCGDPSHFSAVSEQVELLESKGIQCRIVPGVSSFSAAAAALGMELTCPEVSQAVVLARMEGRTPLPPGFRIVDVLHPSATVAVYLSGGLAEKLKQEFLSAGYPPQYPAVAVQRASWGEEERIVKTTLSALPRRLAEEGMDRQTLILLGDALSREKRMDRRSRLYGG